VSIFIEPSKDRTLLTIGSLDHYLEDIRSDSNAINLLLSSDQFDLSRSNNQMLKKAQVVGERNASTLQTIEKNSEETTITIKQLSSRLKTIESHEEKMRRQEAEEEFQRVLSWLSPLDYRGKHERIIEGCYRESGQWFIDNEEFVEWSKGNSFTLRCFADAGSGKVSFSMAHTSICRLIFQ
jgi:hypothetical protein